MKLLLVDDHIVVREGLRRLLSAFFDLVVIEGTSSQEALTLFRAEHPDLVLLDLNLPGIGGLELLRRFLILEPNARVLVFSMHANPIYVAKALDAGARGYVSKGAPAQELVEAVKIVAAGGRYLEREIATELALHPGEHRELSARELDILRLLALGKSLGAIAGELGMSYKTVANSCTAIKQKMMLQTSGELVKLAIEIHGS
jgi:two-component system, NarL family, invasion response regulator UvrY